MITASLGVQARPQRDCGWQPGAPDESRFSSALGAEAAKSNVCTRLSVRLVRLTLCSGRSWRVSRAYFTARLVAMRIQPGRELALAAYVPRSDNPQKKPLVPGLQLPPIVNHAVHEADHRAAVLLQQVIKCCWSPALTRSMTSASEKPRSQREGHPRGGTESPAYQPCQEKLCSMATLVTFMETRCFQKVAWLYAAFWARF